MKEAQLNVPHLFRCPISLDLFKDPVTLCTGQTYERSSIEKWLATGNFTCPVTMQELHDPSLVPNHTLRHLIEQWLQMDHPSDPDYPTTIDVLSILKQNLESLDATLESKLQVVEKIHALLEESSSSKNCLLQLGFLPLLLELVFGTEEGKPFKENLKLVEESLSCILRLLVLDDLRCLNFLKIGSKLASFFELFDQGTESIKMNLCLIIESISSSSDTRELRHLLGQNRNFLRGVIHLVHENSGVSDHGIKAISALCSSEMNQQNLVGEGIVGALVAYISSPEKQKKGLVPLALQTLERLLKHERAQEELIENPNGVSSVVKMVFRVSDHEGSEAAVSSLMTICSSSLKAQEDAIGAGLLTQLLLLLQSQCSGGTKTKARMLLKILRSKSGRNHKAVKSTNVGY